MEGPMIKEVKENAFTFKDLITSLGDCNNQLESIYVDLHRSLTNLGISKPLQGLEPESVH